MIKIRTEDVRKFMIDLGLGHWNEHLEYPLADWKHEIANDNTRLGYWEWLFQRECGGCA